MSRRFPLYLYEKMAQLLTKYNSSNTIEILQREWSFVESSTTKYQYIVTRNVQSCICVYGFDSLNQICFMAHYDCPCSTVTVPYMFKRIANAINPKNNQISVFIEGGWYPYYSNKTKKLIINYLEKLKDRRGWNIVINQYDLTIPTGGKLDVSLEISSRQHTVYRNKELNCIPSIRKGNMRGKLNLSCKAIFYHP